MATSGKSNSQMLLLGHEPIFKSAVASSGLTQDEAFVKLRQYHRENASRLNMAEMFNSDTERYSKYQ